MEIVYSVKNTVAFNSLDVGTVFKHDGEYYIKSHGNALRVYDMTICSFKDEEDVVPCQTKLHIIKEGY